MFAVELYFKSFDNKCMSKIQLSQKLINPGSDIKRKLSSILYDDEKPFWGGKNRNLLKNKSTRGRKEICIYIYFVL